MTNRRFRDCLDYIPLAIFTVSAILLFIKAIDGQFVPNWRHMLGFFFLTLNYIAFFIVHRLGVIATGLIILIGLVGLICFTPVFTISELRIGQVPFFYGQPIFLLWLVVHLIFSARYYFGVISKKYWQDIRISIQSRKR
jgi:hypothetical protein